MFEFACVELHLLGYITVEFEHPHVPIEKGKVDPFFLVLVV